MASRNRKYLLDREKIDRLLKERGIDFDTLWIRAGLAQAPRERVAYQRLVKLAKVLGCRPEDMISGWLSDWRGMPKLGRSDGTPEGDKLQRSTTDALRRAILADMEGRHIAAVRGLRKLRDRLDLETDPEAHLTVWVRLVEALDNADWTDEALAEVDALLANPALRTLKDEELLIWAELNRGRVLQRLRRFDEARSVLETIRNDRANPYRICAAHQLGVLALAEWYFANPDDLPFREERLQFAEVRFSEAVAEWSKLGVTFREGFSQRRLAQIHHVRGNYRAAASHYAKALIGLGYFECVRYVVATQAELEAVLKAQADTLQASADRQAELEHTVQELQRNIVQLKGRLDSRDPSLTAVPAQA